MLAQHASARSSSFGFRFSGSDPEFLYRLQITLTRARRFSLRTTSRAHQRRG